MPFGKFGECDNLCCCCQFHVVFWLKDEKGHCTSKKPSIEALPSQEKLGKITTKITLLFGMIQSLDPGHQRLMFLEVSASPICSDL